MDFVVSREDLHRFQWLDGSEPEPGPGDALLKVDRFAFTANNVTYAVFGEAMSYWNFFPADPGWGRVPVWGFGEVVRSRCDGCSEGQHFYGYFPMSSHLLVRPDAISDSGFVDASAHRQELPPVYNQYTRTSNDPMYDARTEDQQMLFRPLFTTAFLLDDYLLADGFFGAEAVVLTSASSKTAMSLAFLLSRGGAGREVIGLTSPRNRSFVEGLGCYDRIVLYEEVSSLPVRPTAIVDMAGNGEVIGALHHHFGAQTKHSCQVGATHWERTKREEALPGAEPTFFFAPAQAQKRMKEWGGGGLQERVSAAWQGFAEATSGWIRVVPGSGRDAVERVYLETLDGRAKPDEGYVLSL
jgi:hypothetical protein